MKINDDNFAFIAKKYYNDIAADTEEFKEDIRRFLYIRRVLNQYKKSGKLKHRLLINHIILLTNVFDVVSIDLLLFKLPEFEPEIISCLIFLDRIGLSDPRRKKFCPKILEVLNTEFKDV